MLPISDSYAYSTVVGNGVKVNFRPWKTKDEKAFLTLLESSEGVSDNDFLEYLIKPCMEDPTIFLSDADTQHLLIEIRKISMGASFEMKYICKNEDCGQVNEVEIEFEDIVNYKHDTVKEFFDEESKIRIQFSEVKNAEVYAEKTKGKNAVETTFIEMVLRVDKITIDGTVYDVMKYDEIYNWMDNLEVKVFDKLLSYYTENRASMNIEGDFDCLFCGTKNSFFFDEIPNFLVGW